jgi:hypothetical protein
MKVQGSRAPHLSANLPADWVGAGVMLAWEKSRSTLTIAGRFDARTATPFADVRRRL